MESSMDKKPTVLIIDDERNFAESLQLAIEDEFTVSIAVSLENARQVMKVTLPEVVLLDLHLPDGKGTELLCELRKAPLAPIVIVMTAYEGAETCVQVLNKGAVAFLLKPLDVGVLKRQIGEYLKHEYLQRRSNKPSIDDTKGFKQPLSSTR